jgi:uncharacterized protein
MKKGFQLKLAGLLLMTALLAFTCGKEGNDDGSNPGSTDAFKSAMLVNYADNLIVPAYTDLNNKLGALNSSVNAFLAAPSELTLAATREPFKAAYLSFQGVSVLYFGPASAQLLNNYINTFPTVPTRIEKGIETGTYNFNIPQNSDSIQGFPALDYLLYAPDAVNKFSGVGAAKRKKYVQDVLVRMKTLVENTLSQWNGPYHHTFIASLKTDVGSSIGSLVNQFAYEMDALKGPRIGWPFGKQSNGIVFADKCEGYYSGISAELAIANLSSLKNYYTGANGDGIADYLVLLKKQDLNNAVLAQFDLTLAALNAIPKPLSAAFVNNPALVEDAYKQVQKLLTLIKTDLASATAVQITYQDNDGD